MINSISFCVIHLAHDVPFFKGCIAGILLQEIPDFEILVYSRFPVNETNDNRIKFVDAGKLKLNNLNEARNYLFTQARKEHIVFMDHFVVLTPGWYESIKQVNYYDVFGTRLLSPEHERYVDWGVEKSDKTLSPLHYDEWTNKAFVNGALLIVKRQVMDYLQFDARLHSWENDDVNFCLNAAEIGFRVGVIPEGAAVWHRNLHKRPFNKYLPLSSGSEICQPKKKTFLTSAVSFLTSFLRQSRE